MTRNGEAKSIWTVYQPCCRCRSARAGGTRPYDAMRHRRRRGPEVDPDELIAADRHGAFPMEAPERGHAPIEYFTASPRAIMPGKTA